MRQEAHLQVFDLILETRTPVFIGSGKQYTKKEYLYDNRSGMVSFVNEQLLFAALAEHNLADAYEDFVLRAPRTTLLEFLRDTCRFSRAQIDGLVRCQVWAGDALEAGVSLKEIHRFIRNGNEQVYVPGSSIKGALRTTLLKSMILQTPPAQRQGLTDQNVRELEASYLHTLSLKLDRYRNVDIASPLNSLMQGIRISDSRPIGDDRLCLAAKIDLLPNGKENRLNLFRESLRPGTRICCTLTLDRSVLGSSITADSLRKAIADAADLYQRTLLDHYPNPGIAMTPGTLVLGGGVGFQSKTLEEPYCGPDALKETAAILQRRFAIHSHDTDYRHGISPRSLKQTTADGVTQPWGLCEVILK